MNFQILVHPKLSFYFDVFVFPTNKEMLKTLYPNRANYLSYQAAFKWDYPCQPKNCFGALYFNQEYLYLTTIIHEATHAACQVFRMLNLNYNFKNEEMRKEEILCSLIENLTYQLSLELFPDKQIAENVPNYLVESWDSADAAYWLWNYLAAVSSSYLAQTNEKPLDLLAAKV